MLIRAISKYSLTPKSADLYIGENVLHYMEIMVIFVML